MKVTLILHNFLLCKKDLCYLKRIFHIFKILCNIFPNIHRSTATWPLDPPKDEKQGWRHVRIKQMGKNASGQTHYLSLSGFELYGTVNGVCEDQLGKERTVDFSNLLNNYTYRK